MIGPRRATRAVRVARHRENGVNQLRDTVAVEEPLEMRVSWSDAAGCRHVEPLAVTMRTPGDDFELVAGFLHGEGVVSHMDDIAQLTYCRGAELQKYNVVEARLSNGVEFDAERLKRNFYTTSSCGVCGKASLEAVRDHGCESVADGFQVQSDLLPELPDKLLGEQAVFARTGGLHGAATFDGSGKLLTVREDIGRHNAVDKVLGHAFLNRLLPASERILVLSGRASFELVQKAVIAGVPVLVAVGAPSSLAVDLASSFNQTLVGFTRNSGFNVYCGESRLK